MDSYWLSGFSDWLINLSAGWFAGALVVPVIGKKPPKKNLWLLTLNIFFAILTLLVAVEIKRFLGVV